VASSDATNMQATALIEGDHVVLNGLKWWSSGLDIPTAGCSIFMGITERSASKYQRHSMVLVPLDTPGVKIERMVPVFGSYDSPFGHGEVSFTNVRYRSTTSSRDRARGFEIAQGAAPVPAVFINCMRTLGAAERALELLCRRSLTFAWPSANLWPNWAPTPNVIANARIHAGAGPSSYPQGRMYA